MNTLLPETHSLALVFTDIAKLYNAGEDDRRFVVNLRPMLWKTLKLKYHENPGGPQDEFEAKKKAPIWIKKNCFQNFKVAVASVLHDEWRKPRLLPDGTYDSRPKVVRFCAFACQTLVWMIPANFQKFPRLGGRSHVRHRKSCFS